MLMLSKASSHGDMAAVDPIFRAFILMCISTGTGSGGTQAIRSHRNLQCPR